MTASSSASDDGSVDQIRTGIIIVDHGSRRQASNDMLLEAVDQFASQSDFEIIEPAHMELASPDIATAFARCVQRGASRVVVFPYFLSVGRHWSEDIPNLVQAAASDYPSVEWLVTAPFGLHPGMSAIISDRISRCMQMAEAGDTTGENCDVCHDRTACRFRHGDPS
jgi:sirohydrochlorin ferrochelatase